MISYVFIEYLDIDIYFMELTLEKRFALYLGPREWHNNSKGGKKMGNKN